MEKLNRNNLPGHVAIIMDGNGRWAQKKGKPRTYGHIKGVDSVRRIVEAAVRGGIKYLTLYVFSRENWKRPETEVKTLMQLIIKNIRRETKNFKKNGIRLLVIGNFKSLPPRVHNELQKEIKKTADNKTMTLILAINYSGRQEIVNAAREIATKVKEKEISPDNINDSLFSSYLNTHQVPDPDLVIRTSGENRISNFLLWQIAYSELLFVKKNWPEFTEEDFYGAIANYQQRKSTSIHKRMNNSPISSK
jgi:undecaprenyl diphosphate synthase